MNKIALADGGWFYPKESQCFDEDNYFDGKNCISRATGSQWDHEELYYTRHNNFILRRWSQWQGSTDTYNQISAEEAAEWLVRNSYDTEDLPESIQTIVSEDIQKMEV